MAGTIFLKPFCLPAGALRENLKWQFANWMLSLGKFGSVFLKSCSDIQHSFGNYVSKRIVTKNKRYQLSCLWHTHTA